MAKLNDVAAEMTTLLKSFNEVITTDESKNALQDSISNLKDITESVKNIVATNDKNIQEVIDNAKNMTDMIERIIAKNENQLNSSISNIAEISETLKAFTASVDKLVANNQGNIDDSLKNLKEITDKVNTTMDEIETITKDINEGKGTLGLLINDEETKKDVKNVVSKMSSFLGDSNSADNENGMALYTTIGADFLFDAKSVYTGRGYVQAQFYSDPKNFYLIGLSNIPPIAPNSPEYDIYGSKIKYSELAISLQYSHIFANVFGVRFGVFDNTLGLAADIYPLKNNNLAISLEAYDFNTYQNSLDVYTKAYIRWHFYKGIFIQAGVEDIIGNVNRMYMVGAGYRFKPTEIGKVAKNKEEAVKKEENTIYKDYEEQKDEQKQLEKNNNTEKQVIKEDKAENNKKENNDNKKSKKNDDFFDSLVY